MITGRLPISKVGRHRSSVHVPLRSILQQLSVVSLAAFCYPSAQTLTAPHRLSLIEPCTIHSTRTPATAFPSGHISANCRCSLLVSTQHRPAILASLAAPAGRSVFPHPHRPTRAASLFRRPHRLSLRSLHTSPAHLLHHEPSPLPPSSATLLFLDPYITFLRKLRFFAWLDLFLSQVVFNHSPHIARTTGAFDHPVSDRYLLSDHPARSCIHKDLFIVFYAKFQISPYRKVIYHKDSRFYVCQGIKVRNSYVFAVVDIVLCVRITDGSPAVVRGIDTFLTEYPLQFRSS